MKTLRSLLATIILLATVNMVYSQDPNFSQFFSSPLNINPALTANINADWRVICNLRDQWIGPASPYMTGTISYDTKILQNKTPDANESNFIGLGGMLMYDKAMGGVAKSTYGSLNLSYNVKLAQDEDNNTQKLSMGFGVIYGKKNVDFSKLDFEEQFTGHGFDTNLPTGETSLANMKPYISISAGLVYSLSSEKSNLDLGVAAFHVNKPKQSFMEDENQRLAMRKVLHANFETIISDKVVLNTNAIYQNQSRASYFSVGGSLGYYLDDEDAEEKGTMINAGLWYWSKNAVIPYVGLVYKDLQIGLSYDVTISKLAQAAKKPSTFEVSLILRGARRASGAIPCPWK